MAEPLTPRQKLSALIITYNEIGYIEKCIESISFADEIIVVDSYSTDGTYEFLLKQPKVKVIQHPFKNFTAQKSYALEQATNDWVLFIDADEVVPKALESEIIETINHSNACEAYWFYRKFMFENEKLNFSGWQTDKNHRLFKKSKVKFTDTKLVHETLEVDGKSASLNAKLTHFCFKNYKDYKSKMIHYGLLRAQEEFRNGKKFTYLKLILKPTWKFFYNFVIRLGFLDLKRGVTICYLNALSVYKRYMELYSLERSHTYPMYTKLSKNQSLQLNEKRLAS